MMPIAIGVSGMMNIRACELHHCRGCHPHGAQWQSTEKAPMLLKRVSEDDLGPQSDQNLQSCPSSEFWVWFLGWEDLLEEEMATHPSILAWRIPWTEEPGGLQPMGLQRVGHYWETNPEPNGSNLMNNLWWVRRNSHCLHPSPSLQPSVFSPVRTYVIIREP